MSVVVACSHNLSCVGFLFENDDWAIYGLKADRAGRIVWLGERQLPLSEGNFECRRQGTVDALRFGIVLLSIW